MRYSLRSLLIVMLLAGPLCGFAWSCWTEYREYCNEQAALAAQPLQFSPPQLLVASDQRLPELPQLKWQLPDRDVAPMHHPLENADSAMGMN